MAIVLTCRRCLQSRTMTAEAIPSPCLCPFCLLELDVPALPVSDPEPPARPKRRRARTWPLAVITLGLLLVPAGLFAALALRTRPTAEPPQPTAAAPNPAIALRPEPTKPDRVLSAAAVEQVVVQDRRVDPLPVRPPPVEVP